jgi:hypothetical protein
LAFKIIAILHNKLLATFLQLLEIVSKGLFRNQSQNRCHTLLDCRHVCKTFAFHDVIQAGKQQAVHPPYSPDLAPAGARSEAIQKRVTAVQRSIPKDALAAIFQMLYELCQHCVVKDGDYFEGQ